MVLKKISLVGTLVYTRVWRVLSTFSIKSTTKLSPKLEGNLSRLKLGASQTTNGHWLVGSRSRWGRCTAGWRTRCLSSRRTGTNNNKKLSSFFMQWLQADILIETFPHVWRVVFAFSAGRRESWVGVTTASLIYKTARLPSSHRQLSTRCPLVDAP